MTADLLTLGEALIEFLRVPDDDARVLYEMGFGGDTSNTAIAAARQGASVGYVSAVGDDEFGHALRNLWATENVSDTHVLTRSGDPTGVYFVRPHASGREFTYARRGSAASHYRPEDLPVQAIAAAKVLHASGLSQSISPEMRATVQRGAKLAREHGTLFSYDINLRLKMWSLEDARAASAEILPYVDIVFPSHDEAIILTGITDPDAILSHYLDFGAAIVVLKLGDAGAVVATPDRRTVIPAAPATPVDSTGAGDSFAGAFIAYFLETGDPVRSGYLASRVAAGTVSGFGAVAPIPRRNDPRLDFGT
jgi:2-dehydro-3-deoxygluconokinase